jgi:hypothetical protein
LKFIQIIVELLESFDESDEAGRNARVRIESSLDDSPLVEQGLEAQRELQESVLLHREERSVYLGFFVEVEDVDLFNFSFLSKDQKMN